MAKSGYRIPFCEGDMLAYADYWRGTVEWRDNEQFEATLKYVGFERGRSAAHLIFEDENGHSFPMFLQQFDEIMHAGGFDGNKIYGKWVGVKRGQNYGVQLFCYLPKL